LVEYPREEARNGSEVCSYFLSELSDRDPSWLGVDFHGGCLVLGAFPKVLDDMNYELEEKEQCCWVVGGSELIVGTVGLREPADWRCSLVLLESTK